MPSFSSWEIKKIAIKVNTIKKDFAHFFGDPFTYGPLKLFYRKGEEG